MFDFFEHGERVLVYGQDDINCPEFDDYLYGEIIKPDSESDDSAYWHFKPREDVVFSCGMLKQISKKLSELNGK